MKSNETSMAINGMAIKIDELAVTIKEDAIKQQGLRMKIDEIEIKNNATQ